VEYNELGATFEQFMKGQVDEGSNPFSTRMIDGPTSWIENGSTLDLEVSRFNSDKPKFEVKVKVGYFVNLRFTSSKWGQFTSLVNAFRDEGFNDIRIDDYNTGIGGDSVMTVRLAPADTLELDFGISPKPQMILNLRREVEMDAGGYEVVENMSKSADIQIELLTIDHYADPGTNQNTDEGTVEGVGADDVTPLEPEKNPDNDPSLVPTEDTPEYEIGNGVIILMILGAVAVFMVVRNE